MNIIISGYGAMGKTLLDEIGNVKAFGVCGVVDMQQEYGVSDFSQIETSCDVVIDFSHPDQLHTVLDYGLDTKTPLVIATTGMSHEQEKAIETASKHIPILYTGNTSLGINVMNHIVKHMTDVLDDFDIEIIEKHHNQKIDAPSGTAKMLLSSVQERRNIKAVYGRNGVSKRDKNDITIHALRGGTIPGEHSVIYAGDDELIEIKHTALSKRIFAKGALKAAQYIIKQPSGLYDMTDVLKKGDVS
ncbi:MAG: 4-hydroxy-tetrahydrodipicolinate reductase [Candidatus Izemoplasma sp.]|nr:4-hydroxy-tetrahydrodipicolinate reductase [Candidatus Izemoplasma sp.]